MKETRNEPIKNWESAANDRKLRTIQAKTIHGSSSGSLRACSDRRPYLTLRKRFCHPAFSIDLAITERDLGPPYSPLLSNSQSLCVSQSAKRLNTANMACCLDLIPEASCPCCVRNARTLLIFGMNVFFSYFSASIRRISFFSLSTTSKASTKSVALRLNLGLL